MITSPGTTPPPRYIRTPTWGRLPLTGALAGRNDGHRRGLPGRKGPALRLAPTGRVHIVTTGPRGRRPWDEHRAPPPAPRAMPPRPTATGDRETAEVVDSRLTRSIHQRCSASCAPPSPVGPDWWHCGPVRYWAQLLRHILGSFHRSPRSHGCGSRRPRSRPPATLTYSPGAEVTHDRRYCSVPEGNGVRLGQSFHSQEEQDNRYG